MAYCPCMNTARGRKLRMFFGRIYVHSVVESSFLTGRLLNFSSMWAKSIVWKSCCLLKLSPCVGFFKIIFETVPTNQDIEGN